MYRPAKDLVLALKEVRLNVFSQPVFNTSPFNIHFTLTNPKPNIYPISHLISSPQTCTICLMHLPNADIPFQKEHVAVTSAVSYAIPLGFHYDLQGLRPLLNVMKGIFCLGSKSGCLHHMAPVPKSHRSKSLRWHAAMLRWATALLMLGLACETF